MGAQVGQVLGSLSQRVLGQYDVAVPRTGPNTESWFKAESVWCAADRKAEFTKAKLGDELKLKKCPESPVAKEYKLGQDIGITGTPGIVLESGELIPGYLSPKDLVARLDETAVKERAAKIAAGAVTNAQLAANSVATANIQAGAVTNAQLAANAVATAASTALPPADNTRSAAAAPSFWPTTCCRVRCRVRFLPR